MLKSFDKEFDEKTSLQGSFHTDTTTKPLMQSSHSIANNEPHSHKRF